jgi:hypothetical protein
VSSRPNPARLAEYQARLADLVAARDAARAQSTGHRVKLLNRQIQAQLRWIRRAAEVA